VPDEKERESFIGEIAEKSRGEETAVIETGSGVERLNSKGAPGKFGGARASEARRRTEEAPERSLNRGTKIKKKKVEIK